MCPTGVIILIYCVPVVFFYTKRRKKERKIVFFSLYFKSRFKWIIDKKISNADKQPSNALKERREPFKRFGWIVDRTLYAGDKCTKKLGKMTQTRPVSSCSDAPFLFWIWCLCFRLNRRLFLMLFSLHLASGLSVCLRGCHGDCGKRTCPTRTIPKL